MNTLSRIWACAKADFLDRVRRFSFLAMCALTVLATFWFVPKPSGFTAMVIEPGSVLQASDASWVPMSAALCGGMVLCLAGFAYIKNAVRLDRETGVLSLLGVSPLGRFSYLLGKLLSNFLLLSLLLAAEAVGAFLTMLIQFPGQFPPFYAFLSPFLAVLPGLAFVSAAALFTECVPFFSRGAGSGVATGLFFCLFVCVLTFGSMGLDLLGITSVFDFSGYLWLRESISHAVRSVTGKPALQISVFTNFHTSGNELKPVVFSGLVLSARFLANKLLLLVFSLFLTAFSSLCLPRGEKSSRRRAAQAYKPEKETPVPVCRRRYAPVSSSGASAAGLIPSELRMMFAERSALWRITAIGLWIASLFAPLETVRGTLLPVAFGWMLPVFSRMGCREQKSGMTSVLLTVDGAPLRQAGACWAAGLAASVSASLPLSFRLLVSGEETGFAACLAFALLVPSLALFLGDWTGTDRAFELVFLMLCYLMLNLPDLMLPLAPGAQPLLRIAAFCLAGIGMLLLTVGKRAAEQKAPLRTR